MMAYTIGEDLPLIRGFMVRGGLSFGTMNPESAAYAELHMEENQYASNRKINNFNGVKL